MYLRKYKFKMLTRLQYACMLHSGDLFISLGLNDAYFHLQVSVSSTQELFEIVFEMQGSIASPSPMKETDIHLATLLDDWLICARSQQEAHDHIGGSYQCLQWYELVHRIHLSSLDFIVNRLVYSCQSNALFFFSEAL